METYGNDTCIPTAIMSQEPPKPIKRDRKAYYAGWLAKNREKVRAYLKQYYQERKELLAARSNQYYHTNRSDCLTKQREYRVKNLATIRQKDLVRGRAKYRKNPQATLQRLRKWRKENPGKFRVQAIRSAAVRRGRTGPGNFNSELLAQKLDYFDHQCVYCRKKGRLQWDHVKPLAKGGANLLCNLVPACGSCNAKKKDIWHGVQWWLRCRDYGVTVLQNTPQPAPHSGNAEKI